MQRYNMFNQVHKGLRALLYDTAMQVQHTDFWNADEAADALRCIREVVSLFDKHAHAEDRYVFPAVKQYEPSVADLFEQEHIEDHQLGEELLGAGSAYEAAVVITDKALIAPRICRLYDRFVAFNLDHMTKEEEVLNPILWRYYSDEELFGITREIVSQVPAQVMAKMNKWMLRGLHTGEIIGWLKNTEANAPEFVYHSLLATAENELPDHRFSQVVKGLSEVVANA